MSTSISLNGAPYELADGTSVAGLILRITGSLRGSAAVVGGAVVPRSTWESRTFAAGDVVEIVTAVQGG